MKKMYLNYTCFIFLMSSIELICHKYIHINIKYLWIIRKYQSHMIIEVTTSRYVYGLE